VDHMAPGLTLLDAQMEHRLEDERVLRARALRRSGDRLVAAAGLVGHDGAPLPLLDPRVGSRREGEGGGGRGGEPPPRPLGRPQPPPAGSPSPPAAPSRELWSLRRARSSSGESLACIVGSARNFRRFLGTIAQPLATSVVRRRTAAVSALGMRRRLYHAAFSP